MDEVYTNGSNKWSFTVEETGMVLIKSLVRKDAYAEKNRHLSQWVPVSFVRVPLQVLKEFVDGV